MVKKVVSLVVALILVFSLTSVAFAIPSATGSSVAGQSENVKNVTINSISSTKQAELTNTANEYIANKFGADYTADVLLAVDLNVERTNNEPATISLNVAGVKVGDKVIISHQKADGTIELVEGTVVANGVVKFTLKEFSPICVLRVVPKAAGAAPEMPKTGDSSNTVPMALLLMVSVAALAVCGKSLKSAR